MPLPHLPGFVSLEPLARPDLLAVRTDAWIADAPTFWRRPWRSCLRGIPSSQGGWP